MLHGLASKYVIFHYIFTSQGLRVLELVLQDKVGSDIGLLRKFMMCLEVKKVTPSKQCVISSSKLWKTAVL